MDTQYCLHPVVSSSGVSYPCGKCPVCRMKYRKQMALRMYMEKCIDKPDYSYFITLTYDDQFIPELKGRKCFSKNHLTTFIDSLRHRLRDKGYTLRYFGTCEYGEEGYRPHYHFIFYLYHIPGTRFEKIPKFSPGKWFPHLYFAEQICLPLWNKGFVSESVATIGDIMYCTAYALKDDEALERDWTGFEEGKPFRLFSRKPGLGLTDSCVEWFSNFIFNGGYARNTISVNGPKKRVGCGIPTGIKRKLRLQYEDVYNILKESNLQHFDESQTQLFNNALLYGSKRIVFNEKLGIKLDYTPDEEIKAFRKALRIQSKRNRQ